MSFFHKPKSLRSVIAAGLLSSAAVLSVAPIAYAQQAMGETKQQNVSIPAGSLGETLFAIADVFNVSVIADQAMTNGKTSEAIIGEVSVTDALSRALKNAQLEANQTATGAFVIAQSKTTSANGLQTRGSDATTTATESTEVIIVEGDAFSTTDGLLAKNSSTGSRFPVKTELLPNTIRILPQELIDTTRSTLPQEITRYVSGIQATPAFGSSVGFFIRGFFADFETLQNGLRISDSPGDLSNVERVEVLKGPISSLYGGTGAYAGNVNVITKRPLEEFRGEVVAYAGSDNFYRVEGDVGGPINQDGSLRYRLTGAIEDAGSFIEFVDSQKYIGSGSLEWDVNETSNVRLDGSFLRRDYDFYEGLPIIDGNNAAGITTLDIPIERSIADADFEKDRETFWSIGGEGNFGIADDLTLRLAGLYAKYDIEIGPNRVFASPAAEGDGRLFDRVTSEGPQDIERYTLQADLIYRTDAIGKETVFLLGYERFDRRYDFTAQTRTLGQLDVISGVRQPAPTAELVPFFSGFVGYDGDAVYGQIFSQVNDRLSILVGLRQDWLTTEAEFDGFGEPISNSQLSPRVGGTYKVTENTTVFANWGTAFFPAFAFDRDGDVFDADNIRQIELGIRQNLFDDRAQFTIAAFDIKRSNVVIPDINDFAQSINSGEQISRGLEVDFTGEILPGLDIIFTYTFNKTEVTEDDDPNVGQQLPGAPRNSASAFVQYEFQNGPVKGLGLNAGLVWNGDIQASLPNTVVIPSNARLDLGVNYTYNEKWRFAVNLNNVTDSTAYATNLFALFPQAPRQFLFTVSRGFGG